MKKGIVTVSRLCGGFPDGLPQGFWGVSAGLHGRKAKGEGLQDDRSEVYRRDVGVPALKKIREKRGNEHEPV